MGGSLASPWLPQPIIHPVILTRTNAPDYQTILAHIEAAQAKLHQTKRLDIPGFRPTLLEENGAELFRSALLASAGVRGGGWSGPGLVSLPGG